MTDDNKKRGSLTFRPPLVWLEMLDKWRGEQEFVPTRTDVILEAVSRFIAEKLSAKNAHHTRSDCADDQHKNHEQP